MRRWREEALAKGGEVGTGHGRTGASDAWIGHGVSSVPIAALPGWQQGGNGEEEEDDDDDDDEEEQLDSLLPCDVTLLNPLPMMTTATIAVEEQPDYPYSKKARRKKKQQKTSTAEQQQQQQQQQQQRQQPQPSPRMPPVFLDVQGPSGAFRWLGRVPMGSRAFAMASDRTGGRSSGASAASGRHVGQHHQYEHQHQHHQHQHQHQHQQH